MGFTVEGQLSRVLGLSGFRVYKGSFKGLYKGYYYYTGTIRVQGFWAVEGSGFRGVSGLGPRFSEVGCMRVDGFSILVTGLCAEDLYE